MGSTTSLMQAPVREQIHINLRIPMEAIVGQELALCKVNTLFCYLAMFLCLASCKSHSPIERQLVGKWGRVERQADQSQTAVEITFTSAGTYSWSFRGKTPVLTGRWRVDGHQLTTTVQTQAKDSGLPLVPPELKYRIIRITERELIIDDGTTESGWIRVQ
jgi:hypothetical protein